MSLVTQSTLVRYVRWGVAAASIAVTAACGGGGGGGNSPQPTGNVSPYNYSFSAINLTMNATRVSGVAPLAISFDTVGTTSTETALPFHEIQYAWDFGDPAGGAVWAYGTRAAATTKASKNEAFGPVVAHIFETPGLYSVKVTASDGKTLSATKTILISVSDPDVAFSNNTICLSSTSTPVAGLGGCPANAAVLQNSNWASVSSLSNTYKRILLKRGDVWSTNGTASLSNGPGIISSYGSTGAPPKISMDVDSFAFYFNGVNSSDWRLVDMQVTSNANSGSSRRGVRAFYNKDTLLLRMDISSAWIGVEAFNANGLYIVDSYIHDTFSNQGGAIGAYLDRVDRLAVLGSKVSNIPDNHAFRVQGSAFSVISNNQFDTPKYSGNVLTIRGKEDSVPGTWTGDWTENVVVSENVIDGSMGSGYVLYFGPVNAQAAERLRNVIAEGNFIRAKNSYGAFLTVVENATFRNNIIVSSEYPFSMAIGGGNPAGSPNPKSTYIYNNTFWKPSASVVNHYSAVNITNGGNSYQATGTVMKGNVAFAPGNIKDGSQQGSSATFLSAFSVPSSDYFAISNSSNAQVNSVQPWVAANPIVPQDFRPIGYALGGGSGAPVLDDFFRVPLTLAPQHLGALNP